MNQSYRLLLAFAALLFSSIVSAEQGYEFSTKQDIVVIGDIHGAYSNLVTALKSRGVVDENNDWNAGKKHFVSLGDMLDRGPDSRKVMDLFIKLQKQASEAGGRFHIVLGNHEVMNLKGDLRYVSQKEYQAFVADETEEERKANYKRFLKVYGAKNSKKARSQFNTNFPHGYFAFKRAFKSDGYYGKWLLTLPFVIKINEQVFAHGGLSPAVKDKSLEEINLELKDSLQKYLQSWDKISNKNKRIFYPAYKQRYSLVAKLGNDRTNKQFLRTESSLLFSQTGPTWYRGNSLCHPYYETDRLSQVLNGLKAKRLWVGHTTTFNLKPLKRLDDKLVILDTGMLKQYYGGLPHVAVINPSGDYQVYNGLNGKLVKVKKSPNRESSNPFGLAEKKMKIVMKQAKVKSTKGDSGDFEQGKTVILDYQGHQFEARFFTYDEAPGAESGEWKDTYVGARRYHYELAAFKLDRMLGIGLVPTTIEKEIDGVAGALQLVPEKTISESDLVNRFGGEIRGCHRDDQRNLKDVFDYLVQNEIGRRAESRYSKSDGQIWFLGHSQTFSPSTRFTSKNRPEEVFVSPAFKKALLALSKDDLKALDKWLNANQIDAIWARRERLIQGN